MAAHASVSAVPRLGSMENYEIVRRVTSKGAFGEIFVVKHKKEGKGNQYVMKRAKMTKMNEGERARLAAEVHIHHQMQRGLPDQHENIVAFKESFADRGVFGCILLEFCTGGDLASKMNTYRNKNRMLAEDQALEWFGQINSAVEYVHSQRIMHRDIKMQNVFLTADGTCKLGDFGLAIALPEDCDTVTETLGTITAMAPELFDRKPGGLPSDVWALGTLLYEMCAQTNICDVPCDSYGLIVTRYRSNLRKPIRPLRSITTASDGYTEPLQRLVDNLLQVDQRRRPTCAQVTVFMTDLAGLVPHVEKPVKKKEAKSKIATQWKVGKEPGAAVAAGAEGGDGGVPEPTFKTKAPAVPLSGRRAAKDAEPKKPVKPKVFGGNTVSNTDSGPARKAGAGSRPAPGERKSSARRKGPGLSATVGEVPPPTPTPTPNHTHTHPPLPGHSQLHCQALTVGPCPVQAARLRIEEIKAKAQAKADRGMAVKAGGVAGTEQSDEACENSGAVSVSQSAPTVPKLEPAEASTMVGAIDNLCTDYSAARFGRRGPSAADKLNGAAAGGNIGRGGSRADMSDSPSFSRRRDRAASAGPVSPSSKPKPEGKPSARKRRPLSARSPKDAAKMKAKGDSSLVSPKKSLGNAAQGLGGRPGSRGSFGPNSNVSAGRPGSRGCAAPAAPPADALPHSFLVRSPLKGRTAPAERPASSGTRRSRRGHTV